MKGMKVTGLKKETKHTKFWLVIIGCLIVLVPVAWFLIVRLEAQGPKLEVDLVSGFLGRSQELSIAVSDAESGLRQLSVALLKDGKEAVLHDETFPSGGLFKGGSVQQISVKIPVAPQNLGFSDGDAVLRMVVRDYSWRDWWRGNKTYIEKKVVIDTRAPQIEVFSRAHNINMGGAGVVIFRTSEDCSLAGVQVGSEFYPGYNGIFSAPRVYVAFFALGYEQGPDTEILVKATDPAGNQGQSGLYHHIRRQDFRHDRINITDRFLERKLPDFSAELPQDPKMSDLDRFLIVNRDLRQADYSKITEVCRTSGNKMLWRGEFLRLPKSANRARFADHRTYYYKGKEIDRQVHLGIDLASLAQSPVPAANAGSVVFGGTLGIYGETVMIGHGLRLFSMYSHLSHIAVKPGDRVSKGDNIGRTGSTGLAGGDHLHFSMLVNGTFVNPVEWWDEKWIENNVMSKIEQVKTTIK
jgi:murein DD-endopeptidase MepM/ murein hydrolase activator NlpD